MVDLLNEEGPNTPLSIEKMYEQSSLNKELETLDLLGSSPDTLKEKSE